MRKIGEVVFHMGQHRTGFHNVIVFYVLLALVIFASMNFPQWSAALIGYSLIIFASYLFRKREGGFFWGASLKPGFLFGFLLISLVFIIEFGLGWLTFGELYPHALSILMAALVFEILVSIGEEMAFRGYILPDLMKKLGLGPAIFLSSLMFAGLHIPSIMILGMEVFNTYLMVTSMFAAGILLALLYLQGGLTMSSGFHFSWNFFQYHVFSLREGFGIFGLFAAKPEFTGGHAGPEAGVMGFLAIMLGISIIMLADIHSHKA